MTQQFGREPPDGCHVGEGAGNLFFQSCAFALELFDGALVFRDHLVQFGLLRFDLSVDVGERGVGVIKEKAGVSERGGRRWLTCERV